MRASTITSWFRHRLVRFNLVNYIPDPVLILGTPEEITIETTNVCDLKCPLCARVNMKREGRHMTFTEFKHIIDQFPHLRTVYLHNLGEPLLNPEIFGIIRYASKSRHLYTYLSTNCTTLHLHTNDIFNSGLSTINLCMEGLTKEAHERYRVGSDFQRIKRNIETFCEDKYRRNAQIEIILQVLMTKYNEAQLDRLTDFAKDIGVDHLRLKFISLSLGEIEDQQTLDRRAEEWLPKNPKYRKYFYENGHVRINKPKTPCLWALTPVILSNGDVTVCCLDTNGTYAVGNVFKTSFNKIYRTEKFKLMRKMVLARALPLCKACTTSEKKGSNIIF